VKYSYNDYKKEQVFSRIDPDFIDAGVREIQPKMNSML
jgi:hypothetical protein